MFTQLIALVLAVAKAIPSVERMVLAVSEAILNDKIKDIQDTHATYTDKKNAILLAISQATSHEQKRLLFTALNDLRREV